MNQSGALRGVKAQLIKPVEIKMRPGTNLTEGPTAELPVSGSQPGTALPPRGILAMLRHICGCHPCRGLMLLAFSRLKPGMLLNTLLWPGQPPTTKDCPS